MTKVLSGGTFDIWHLGHVMHLNLCRLLAGGDQRNVHLMIGSDEWIRERKGPGRPVLAYEERRQMLELLGFCVHKVSSPQDMLLCTQEVHPDVYVYEFATNSEGHTLAIDYCKKEEIPTLGLGKIPENPFGTSTTNVIERIQDLVKSPKSKMNIKKAEAEIEKISGTEMFVCGHEYIGNMGYKCIKCGYIRKEVK
jgi:cytidyltransferase-like protein